LFKAVEMWKEKHAFHLMTNIQNSALRKKKEIQRKALFIAVLTLLGKSYSDANMKWEQQACNYDHIFFIEKLSFTQNINFNP